MNIPNSTQSSLEATVMEALAEGPVEPVEPFVNPPVDSGYHPPPLEAVPYTDPFANLADQAAAKIIEYFAQLHAIPWQTVQSAQKKLLSMPKGRHLKPVQQHLLETCLNPKADPIPPLQACRLEELVELQQALQELGQRKMPPNPGPQLLQEQQALQLLYQVVEAECLRRHP